MNDVALSPYVFEESDGLVHIILRADAAHKCRACVRKDAYQIIQNEAYREGYAAAIRDAVARVGGQG